MAGKLQMDADNDKNKLRMDRLLPQPRDYGAAGHE
jgi:hypothetical protein